MKKRNHFLSPAVTPPPQSGWPMVGNGEIERGGSMTRTQERGTKSKGQRLSHMRMSLNRPSRPKVER